MLFQFGPSVTSTTKSNVSSAFVALKDSCRLLDGSRYIVSIDGGLNNSPEGQGKGFEVSPIVPVLSSPLCKRRLAVTRTFRHFLRPCSYISKHAYVLTFRSVAERDYYLDRDPAHQIFKASIAEKVSDVLVFDFESGEFARNALRRRRRPSDELNVRTV